MTWRMTYLVTTLPRPHVEVQMALGDWSFANQTPDAYHHPDARKVGYAVPSPVVKDNAGKTYLCELVETHYNPQQDVLIFVWKPAIEVSELPAEMQAVPDHGPGWQSRKFAGEQDLGAISTGEPQTEA